MALVSFKKGLQANLPSTYTEGTFYVTTDERGLYLDLADQRIRIGDFREVASIEALSQITKPNATALYYVTSANCLAKWDPTGGDSHTGAWVQINPDTGATKIEVAGSAEANGVSVAYDATERKITITMSKIFVTGTEVDGKIAAKVGELGEGYDTVKAYVDEKTSGIASETELNDLKTRIGTAETDIDKLEGLVGEEPVSDQIDAKIEELELDETYAPIEHEHAMSEVEGLDEALAAKASGADLKSATDRIGVLETAKADHETRIGTLEGKIVDLSGAMHFEGVVEEDPAGLSGYENGDVVIWGNKEYVWSDDGFVEFGDVTEVAQRVGALEGKMGAAENDIDALEGKLEGIDETVTAYVGDQISTAKSDLIGSNGGVSATTIKGAVAEATAYTDSALDEIDGEIDDINETLDGLDNKYDAKGTASAAVKALQNGEEISDFGGVEEALAALDDEYDAKGDATAAENNAKAYTDTALTWGTF